MNAWFLLASGILAFTCLLHAIGGERTVLRPLRAKAESRGPFAVVDAAWHLLTWQFAVMALFYVLLAARPMPLVADFLALQWLGYALIFAALSLRRFGRLTTLPQWTLFVALTFLTLAGAGRLPSVSGYALVAASIGATVFAALSALHVYWALGGVWPGRDRATLARTVVGDALGNQFPSRAATLLVALALAAAAALVLWAGGVLHGAPLSPLLLRSLTWILVFVCLLRGIVGFFEIYLRPRIAGTPYAHWNTRLYSPLCLGLSAIVTLTLVG
jgi:hypothetical protein